MSAAPRSYGGKPAEVRVAERRARLVAATVEVFAERGAQTTMTAICSSAGLTERYFYESFTNLDEALLAALDEVADEIARVALRTVEETPGTPEERVHAMTRAFVDLMAASPAKGKVAVIESNTHPGLRVRRRELIGDFADLVAQEAAVLYGDDAWPAPRARVQGIVFIAGFAELLARWLNGDVTLSADDLVETAGDLFAALSRRP